jgi:hypothetical protein
MKNGGCDRDRTCDPYHVNEARAPEIVDFIGNNGTKNGGESRHVPPMFSFSGSMNLRALPDDVIGLCPLSGHAENAIDVTIGCKADMPFCTAYVRF